MLLCVRVASGVRTIKNYEQCQDDQYDELNDEETDDIILNAMLNIHLHKTRDPSMYKNKIKNERQCAKIIIKRYAKMEQNDYTFGAGYLSALRLSVDKEDRCMVEAIKRYFPNLDGYISSYMPSRGMDFFHGEACLFHPFDSVEHVPDFVTDGLSSNPVCKPEIC